MLWDSSMLCCPHVHGLLSLQLQHARLRNFGKHMYRLQLHPCAGNIARDALLRLCAAHHPPASYVAVGPALGSGLLLDAAVAREPSSAEGFGSSGSRAGADAASGAAAWHQAVEAGGSVRSTACKGGSLALVALLLCDLCYNTGWRHVVSLTWSDGFAGSAGVVCYSR